jgi:2-oxo-3-hexenedioate decarboxylase
MNTIDLARRLERARLAREPISQLTDTEPLSLDEAYRVQSAGVDLRLSDGQRVSGAKLGFTSAAKAKQMGVKDVIIGVLMADSEVKTGAVLHRDELIHPRVEAEIAFRLHLDITSATDDPRACVDAVAPALEVIDSRYHDFRFAVEDVIADNTSAARYVIGRWTPVADLNIDLAQARVELKIGGMTAASGIGADILGDPWDAVDAAARLARTHGQRLPAGSVILAGAATEALPLPASGTATAQVEGLGEAVLMVSRSAS